MSSSILEQLGLRLSRYHLATPLPSGERRILSTLWKSVVDLNGRYQQLVYGEVQGATPEERKDLRTLQQLGILVGEDTDEPELAIQAIERWKRPDILSMTYCTTCACNFDCVYCVQKGNYAERPAMGIEMGKKSVEFAFSLLQRYSLPSLEVTFFGGEPLLNSEGMIDIMTTTNDKAARTGLQRLSYCLVTNGSLLDLGLIKVLHSLGLNHIQFTVDGPPNVHNSRRRSADGSWGKIWQNILFATAEGVEVTISMVVDNENVVEIPQFIDIAEKMAYNNPELKQQSLVYSTLATLSDVIARIPLFVHYWAKGRTLQVLWHYREP